MKVALCEIKKNLQGTFLLSDRKETRTQINGLEQKVERNIKPEQNEKTRTQKNEERVRNLWDHFKCLNILMVGVPEEEEEQENKNLFEQIMKENFPNLAKEIDMPVQEAQRVPKKLNVRRATPKHIVIKLPKIKDKERILKAAREKDTVIYKGVPIRLSAGCSKTTLQQEVAGKKYSKSGKAETYIHDYFIQQSLHLECKGR